VKEMRLADAKTCEQANAVLERLLPNHNRRFAKPARETRDAHRRLGPGHRLDSILSIQSERVVANDYTIRFENRIYQLHKPVYPGERGGRVVIEQRLDGTMVIRFRTHTLKYSEVATDGGSLGGSAPKPPEFNASTADANMNQQKRGTSEEAPRSPGMQPSTERSGRTPAEPYPSGGEEGNSSAKPRRPAENHPWRKGNK
jgi:hypothetical protein